MPGVPLTPDELLTTTRSVRKRPDLTRPVPLDLVKECLGMALRAPNGGMREGWPWIVVTGRGDDFSNSGPRGSSGRVTQRNRRHTVSLLPPWERANS